MAYKGARRRLSWQSVTRKQARNDLEIGHEGTPSAADPDPPARGVHNQLLAAEPGRAGPAPHGLPHSDIHSRLLPYDITLDSTDKGLGMYPEAYPYGGAARIRSLYLQQKQTTDRSILIDSGDCFEGARSSTRTMASLSSASCRCFIPTCQPSATTEFDHGTLNLANQAKAWVDYPLLVANYSWEPWTDATESLLGTITRPFDIVNIQGLRVG